MCFEIKGSAVALVTPFNRDGSIDFGKMGELVEWHIQNKTDAIVVMGTTGEPATTTRQEDDAACACVVKRAAGRIPIIAGGGSNSTQTMMDKSLSYQSLGADALLLVTPYYNKANAEGMYRHFSTVADKVDIPCILYNVPSRTGCSISLDVLARLAKHEHIVGIKEASGDIGYTSKAARLIGENFKMYSGNDDMILPILALGGSGVVSVWANIMPETVHNLVSEYMKGNIEEARRIQLSHLDLISALFMEVNPIPVKAALNLMGKNVGSLRLPLFEMEESHKAVLANEMKKVGLL